MLRSLILLLVLAAPAAAQTGSDIWLVRVERFAGGIRLGTPVNVSNRPGYDNQPAFLPDGSAFLYTAIGEDGQADTWRYDLETGRATRVTDTPESEYSPTSTPDGAGVSVVRVEQDSTQRFWRFTGDGETFELLQPDLFPVGYYAWLDDTTTAFFVLGDPPTLQIVRGNAPPDTAAHDIGRTLARDPDGGLTYVQRTPGDSLWIMRYAPVPDSAERLAPAPEHDFFAWTPDGILLAATGTRILLCRPPCPAGWRGVADYGHLGIGPITRIAVSPAGGWLAFVAAEP